MQSLRRSHSASSDRLNGQLVPGNALSNLLTKDQKKLRDFCEISLSDQNDLSLACGEIDCYSPDDNNFSCRLICLDGSRKDRVKYVDISKESFDMLSPHDLTIRRLLVTGFKAIIFQEMDVQVYVMNEDPSKGFLLHFEDFRRVKISINLETFRRLMALRTRVEFEFSKFTSAKNARMRRINRASANAVNGQVGRENWNLLVPMRISKAQRSTSSN